MVLDDAALDQLFREARTYNSFTDEPVTDDDLHHLFDLLKMGPTSANTSPARFLFLRTPASKERLKPALSEGNLAKTMKAPVTAPHVPAIRPMPPPKPEAIFRAASSSNPNCPA